MKKLQKTVSDLAWLWKPCFNYARGFCILYILLQLLTTPIKDYIYVYFPKQVVDMLGQGRSFYQVALYATVISAINYGIIILPLLTYSYFEKKKTGMRLALKRDIYLKARALDYQYIDHPEYYDKYTWAIDEYNKQAEASLDLLRQFLTLAASLGVLYTLIIKTAPWILALDFLQLFFHNRIFHYENKLGIEYQGALLPFRRRFDYFHRIFYQKDYAADLKSSALAPLILEKYDQGRDQYVDTVGKYSKKISFYGLLHETTFCLTEFIIILLLIHAIATGRIVEVGLYITMILAFYRADEKLVFMIQTFAQARGLALNSQKIQEFFAIESEIEKEIDPEALTAAPGPFSLDFSQVDFGYENSDFAISDLNLSVPAGAKIAIVGENGAGKSTLLKLILRLYDVSSGQVMINGIDIRQYDIQKLRQLMGVAFQNSNIYALSYAENLQLYGERTQADLEAITGSLDLDKVLDKNQADFTTEITREFSDSGIMLSGGEMQKMAIARIMGGGFGLLLLDEPSSALDPLSEYKLTKLLLGEANQTTTIIVSHRLSTVREADTILLMSDGKIKEKGSHDELMAMDGIYAEMFTKQSELYGK